MVQFHPAARITLWYIRIAVSSLPFQGGNSGPNPECTTNKLSIGITIGSVCHSDKVETDGSNPSLWTIFWSHSIVVSTLACHARNTGPIPVDSATNRSMM